jgi:hypothetical protein
LQVLREWRIKRNSAALLAFAPHSAFSLPHFLSHRHQERHEGGQYIDSQWREPGGVAVDLDGYFFGGFDADGFAAGVGHAFPPGVFADGDLHDQFNQFGAIAAGHDADVEQAIVGDGVGEDGDADAVFADIADQSDGGGVAEESVIVDGDGDGGKSIGGEGHGHRPEVAGHVDGTTADAVEQMHDLCVDTDTGHQQKEVTIGTAGIEADDFVLPDGVDHRARGGAIRPSNTQVLAHEISGAHGDREDGGAIGAMGVEEIDNASECSVTADGDDGLCGVLKQGLGDIGRAIEEGATSEALGREFSFDFLCQDFSFAATGDGIGEDEDARGGHCDRSLGGRDCRRK